MSNSTLSPREATSRQAPGSVAALADVDEQLRALTAKRDLVLQHVLQDLEWMDVEVTRIPSVYVSGKNAPAPGGKFHIMWQYQELGPYSQRTAHRIEDCTGEPRCAGRAGVLVKGGSRERWRFACLGTFDLLGADGGDFLFVEVTK